MDESKSARSGQPLSSTDILISPQIAGTDMGRKKNFTGQHFWARGYFVTTVGADEKTIRDYIRRQETEDRRLDQLSMFEE